MRDCPVVKSTYAVLVSNTHIRWLTNTYQFRFRKFNSTFVLPWASIHMHIKK